MSDTIDLDSLRERLNNIATLSTSELEAEEVAVLGRKQGELNARLKSLGKLPMEQRREAGAQLNKLKGEFEAAFKARRQELTTTERQDARSALDRSMPGRPD